MPVYPNAKAIKQNLHCIKIEWVSKIKEKLQKRLDVDFLRVFNYIKSVANIILML